MRPNILFITSHDIGRHLGCYGIPTVHSPHLDSLALAGARLANCFCVAPQCSPSRASMVTGRYPHSNGVMGLTHANFGWDMHPGETHLAGRLKQAGYRTILGTFQHEFRSDPVTMGFEEAKAWSDRATPASLKAAQWLREQPAGADQRPFYLQLAYFEPHRGSPGTQFNYEADTDNGVYLPPFVQPEASAQQEFGLFQGAIRALDAGIGQVLLALEETGLANNTLVLFSADHGIPFPRAKCSLYDPGLEIASLWRLPGVIPKGQVLEGLSTNLDYTPTLLDLCGIEVPEGIQGSSMLPTLRGEPTLGHDAIFAEMTFHEYCDPIRCIRTKTHKLLVFFSEAPSFMDSSQSWRPATTPVATPYPAMAYHVPVELYDLRSDPTEAHNLAGDPGHAAVEQQLLVQLYRWMQNTQDPLLQGLPTPPMHQRAMLQLQRAAVG